MCLTRASEWVMSTPFRQRVSHHPVSKPSCSLSLWMCHCVLFYMVWRMPAYGGWIVTGGLPCFCLSCNIKYMIVIFVFWFFNFNPHSFDVLFHSYSFHISFFFQFSSSIIIFHIFFISVLILLILNFFPWPFC